MRPKVSVIITTFKRPHLLAEAIDSVLRQTLKDFELIIIDDNSVNHENENVVSRYHDPRIVYIKNKKNEGSARSLNIGLEYARGVYIAILDDDDIWRSEEKLDAQVKFLKEHRDHVLVGTNVVVMESVERKYVDAKFTLEVLRRHRFYFPHSYLPYYKQWIRYLIFKILRRFPFLYALKQRKN